MRKLALATGMVLFASAVMAPSVQAVPSFTRITGMTCNQCHVSFSPVPTFTFTGKKFRLNGYRAPHVAQKIEAGEEGALSGKRLSLGVTDYLSFRFGSTLLSQSRAAYVEGAATPEASSLQTNPFSNAAIYFVGPIGDHFGIWNEFYINGTGSGNDIFRTLAYDEYDVKFVVNTENSILGATLSTQSLNQALGFGPFPTGLTSHMQRGGVGQAHAPYANVGVYGFFNDRLAAVVGFQAGEDNYEYSCRDVNQNGKRDDGICMNWQTMVAYAISNTDDNELWVNTYFKVGNDAVPITTNVQVNGTTRAFQYADAIQGVRQTRGTTPAQQVAYGAVDIGDVMRNTTEVTWGFIDKGPHSLATSVRASINKDEYADNSSITHHTLGASARYIFDRTYGFNVYAEQDLQHEFTDLRGTTYDIERGLGWGVTATYRPAMNFAVNLTTSNSRITALQTGNASYNNGWSWNLGIDYLF
jgi:hypothetical protein